MLFKYQIHLSLIKDTVSCFIVSQIKDSHKSQIKDMLILDETGFLVCMTANTIDIWNYVEKRKLKVSII